ncbi:MAG: DUF6089 family protein, partial [Ferruginibacter sp.]
MQRFYWKQTALSILFFAFTIAVFAQSTYNTVKPFTGSKEFRKFSVGINAGVLSPSVLVGGSNDFSNPQFDLGYGANLRYQINHYFALQADFLRGKVKGNQDKTLGGDANFPNARPIRSFKTDLKWAGSLNGQFTFGNVNWLREKNIIVPYVAIGAGLLSYTPKISKTSLTDPNTDYDNNSPKTEFFVPVGVGLKVNVAPMINLDLGYRMQFVDGDNFDGSSYWTTRGNSVHKDKFSYGFLG